MSLAKNRQWAWILALLVIASMTLAACAQQQPAPPPAAPTAAPVEPTVAPEQKAPEPTMPPEPTTAPAPTAAPEAAKPAAGECKGGTLTVGLPSGFDRLDPHITTFSRVGNILMHMVDPLVWQPKPGEFKPGLATEWSVNADATEYRFKLREDVKFHDGTPFNADAVKFALDRIVNPETKSQSALSLIGPYSDTVVLSPYEVLVRFKTGYAPFLDSLSGPLLTPISVDAFKKTGPDNWGMTAFVGTGPYKFESMVLDNEIVLVKNPDYKWGPEWTGNTGPACLDKIVYKFVPEAATRTAALETGEIQFEDEVPPIDFPSLKSNPDLVTADLPQPGSGWALMFNFERPPTDQLPVRRAMQLAMDRQGMIDTVFNGFGKPACSPLTSPILCYDPDTCKMYPQNLDEAKKVLEDAGWKEGPDGVRVKDGKPLEVDYYYRADSNEGKDMAEFLKDNFAKIGIKVNLFGLSRSGYFDAVRAGKHNMQAWWETGTDPDLVRVLFHSVNAHGGTNRNNYINPEMDQMIDKAAAEPDVTKRCELYKQIQKKVKDEAITEFWSDPSQMYAYSNKLGNVIFYQGGNTPYYYVSTLSQ